MFIDGRKLLGMADEVAVSGAYSAVVLSNGDFNVRVKNITYGPEINEAKRAYNTGDFGKFESIMGKRKGSISWDVDLAPAVDDSAGSNLGSAPAWADMLEGCGWSATAFSQSWQIQTVATKTAETRTIGVYEIEEGAVASAQQNFIQLAGAMGNVQIILNEIGEFLTLHFEYQGRLEAISDTAAGSAFSGGGYDTSKPVGLLGSTLTAFGSAIDPDSMTIDCQNQLAYIVDPAKGQGVKGVNVTNREPTLTVNPYRQLDSYNTYFSKWVSSTTGAFAASVGTNLSINAAAVQIANAYQAGERDGNTIDEISLNILRGSPELRITQA